jgi:hypothetical protein
MQQMGIISPDSYINLREEDDEEGYREEDDDEEYFEASRRRINRRPNFSSNMRGVTGGRFNVPGAGTAEVKFDKRMASEQSVKEALDKVSKTIEDVRRSMTENNVRIQKQLRRQKSSLSQMQMMSWLPMLLGPSTPKLEKIKFNVATPQEVKADGTTDYAVTPTFTTTGSDSSMMMVVMMMAMGGMSGGQSSGSDSSENENGGSSMSMMMPILALSMLRK